MFDTTSSQHKQGRNIPDHITEYVRDLSLYGFRHGWIRGSGDSKSQPFFSASELFFLHQFGFQAASPPHDVSGYSKSQDCLPTKKAPFPKQL